LNADLIPEPTAAEVGGTRGNQSDAEAGELAGDRLAQKSPERIQDPVRERKAS